MKHIKNNCILIEQRHLETVKALVPVTQQSSVLSMVKKHCNEMEDICNGIFLLGELSARTRDRIMSYGELLSSQIIAQRFKAIGIDAEWKDSRELIRTDSNYGNAVVDFQVTNQLCRNTFLLLQKSFLYFLALFLPTAKT